MCIEGVLIPLLTSYVSTPYPNEVFPFFMNGLFPLLFSHFLLHVNIAKLLIPTGAAHIPFTLGTLWCAIISSLADDVAIACQCIIGACCNLRRPRLSHLEFHSVSSNLSATSELHHSYGSSRKFEVLDPRITCSLWCKL
jgi:hypothetical protein